MLNVAILEEDGQKVKVEVSIQPRALEPTSIVTGKHFLLFLF